ncbi:tetratricopeptide repeat protein [Qipengyuania atrilutea]|uniref:Tetratricopeptide repeat protein n=1 Tax=Qipengyuania atrilutea TaxID=2744473 RepID=A0A850GWT6_9SPHN|nr:tetratricopeptide repeat protein [Actirhodobacter atriluteus]NVD44011.1 tetratricopeptide repeat protein [Actirhodobacter atriluteus]
MILRGKRAALMVCSGIAAMSAASAVAGDEVIFAPAPDWVEPVELTPDLLEKGPPLVLLDKQVRFDEGLVHTFNDVAIALDTPDMLTNVGTLQAGWLPDKGDLTVHRVELIRDGKVIDVLEGGARFDVLRREAALERRELNGFLTATMTLPGAQLGDVVRMATSVTISDQALGEEVQFADLLPSGKDMVRQARMKAMWPQDLPLTLATFRTDISAEAQTVDGMKVWEAKLPIEEPDDMPGDAPLRYLMPPQVQMTTFADWKEVSSVMAQHYRTEGTIAANDGLKSVVERIARENKGEKARAAAALRIVQDDISYLANGMNGGNYLPQSPAETWEQRFGDCKAKSVLLTAMLRELGIESDVVLVASQGGDVLPEVAPRPGGFDHMIVRAVMDGTNYWLDGTNSGTRLGNLSDVPQFFYALPLTEGGSELVALDTRPLEKPNRTAEVTIDSTAGLQVPALYEIDLSFNGPTASQWRGIIQQATPDQLESMIQNTVNGILGETYVVDQSASYDEEAGTVVLKANGIMTTPWSKDRGRFELTPPAQVANDLAFDADRARAKWRDVPLRLNGPLYWTSDVEILLPKGGSGYELLGEEEMDAEIGEVAVSSDATLKGNSFLLQQSMRTLGSELPAADIPEAKRSLTAHLRKLPELRAPEDVREAWQYKGKDRALLAKHDAAYAQMIADAENDEALPWSNRANYRAGIGDFEGAAADYSKAIEIEPNAWLYSQRAAARLQAGDIAASLEDQRAVENIENNGNTYFQQVELLGQLGKTDEAEIAVENYRDLAEKPYLAQQLEAEYLGWSKQADAGLDLMQSLVTSRPGDPALLNGVCWFAGKWNRMDETVLETCTEAILKSDYAPGVLDSRGLAYYRLGQYDKALSDFDAALANDQDLPESRYMRGITLLAKGDDAGRGDIERALAQRPALRAQYAAWGITAPK